MANPGWSHAESPFHAGELAIQARLGVQTQMDKQARRVVRDYLPQQHQQFYSQLPYLLVGTVDASGRPWASILVGEPGFVSSPNDRTLRIASKPLVGDPLSMTLAEGVDIGLLGIELHTRRRNRMNGTVIAVDTDGFTVQVGQSFGNCPQYIQARMFELNSANPTTPQPIYQVKALGEPERTIIAAADTFFIATAFQEKEAGAAKGVDVSHRGGKPGFVQVNDAHTLTIPDFVGNFHFNTFGNLLLNPHAGLLFVDFDRGNLMYLTGTAEIIWDGDEIQSFAGAERLLRFHLLAGYRVEGSLPLRWSAPAFSPFLVGVASLTENRTGSWQEAVSQG